MTKVYKNSNIKNKIHTIAKDEYMGWIKCLILECTRKPIKSFCLFLIMTIIFIGTLIGIQVYHSADYSKEKALEQIGAYILLELKDEYKDEKQNITDDMKRKIGELDYVNGINQSVVEYAIPVNFLNSKKYTGGKYPDVDKRSYQDFIDLTPDSVIIDANLDCTLIDDFRLGKSELIKGENVSSENKGVVIEQTLAELNDLEIGDKIVLTSIHDMEVETEIKGIYKTKASFDLTPDNMIGEAVFAMSPYNKIYASLEVGLQLYEKKEEELSLCIYVDQVSNVQKVGNKIKELEFDWNKYGLFNMTSTMYGMKCEQIEAISNYAKIIYVYSILIGAIILSLVLSVYVKYYCYDAGIFISIGASKGRIVLQYLSSILIIMAGSAFVSIVCSLILGHKVVDFFDVQTQSNYIVQSYFLNGFEDSYKIQKRILGMRQYVMFFLGTIGLTMFSCMPLIIELLHFQPRKILEIERE